ncbi:MAG: hypothetical protein JNM88_02825 [Chitinophagaceae bacterium]|nr:hypothetical protein [Chitinophagaceae bacterium]
MNRRRAATHGGSTHGGSTHGGSTHGGSGRDAMRGVSTLYPQMTTKLRRYILFSGRVRI